MKTLQFLMALIFVPFLTLAQTSFDPEQYQQFLQQNQNLEYDQLLAEHSPATPYFSRTVVDTDLARFAYLDSAQIKLGLTQDERTHLQNHHFVVTQRLSYGSFGQAFHAVYANDLPVFVSSDAVLQALHRSYDTILIDLELGILQPKLQKLVRYLYDSFPQLVTKYQGIATLDTSLADVDLYVTILQSLVEGSEQAPHLPISQNVDEVWKAIQAENYQEMPLFSNRPRQIDFSQFRVRGHYASSFWRHGHEVTLKNYFKAMMWLGRIGFYLTPPPRNPWEPSWTKFEIRRMVLDAVLLNKLVGLAQQSESLRQMDKIIQFFVGESDNLTPDELEGILSKEKILDPLSLLDSATYDNLERALKSAPYAQQKILGNILKVDPYTAHPDTLPVSFRLFGQRFVVDSYIFSNLVYDHIVFKGQKIWRPMPDPLDALFVLGNDDALPLLQHEMETYHYASQAAALRYLVEAYDADFWSLSLYNTWLQCIRELNPKTGTEGIPFFMKTTAWHQEKINTQLASWAELGHDNLLYAKQSYTGATGCSFPRSFVEPYPAFYRQIARFAAKGQAYFSEFTESKFDRAPRMAAYFKRLGEVTDTLAILSEKELRGETFSEAEKFFLKKMLFESTLSGAPPYDGWYADLFYNPEDAALRDFIIADVHTQPTDEQGNPVGRVLHVGVGKVTLGIFLAPAADEFHQPTAFVGPVFSFYQTITKNFKRLTDQVWADSVKEGNLPAQPDWVNVFLTDAKGKALPPGRELPGVEFTGVEEPVAPVPQKFSLWPNYPNPFNPATTIAFELPRKMHVTLTIFDLEGHVVARLLDKTLPAGHTSVRWNARGVSSGVYFCKIKAGKFQATQKMVLLR